MVFSKYRFLNRHSRKIEYPADYDQIVPWERALIRKIEQKFGCLSWIYAFGRIISVKFDRDFTKSQWRALGRFMRFSHLMMIQFQNPMPNKKLTLSSIPNWLSAIPNLCGLKFFDITLDSFPIQVLYCRNLYFLTIVNCGLKKVPDALNLLNKLQIVHFERNQIEKFPEVLFKIPSLKTIRLDYNPISQIPDSWEFLPNLQNLWLTNCQITHFPDDLYRIPFVTLNGNPLEVNNYERLEGMVWGQPWRFEAILAKCRQGQLLEELEILHPLFAKYRTELLAQCEGVQNAAVEQLRNTPARIRVARGRKILL